MSRLRVLIGFAVVALVVSLSVAPASAQYPPNDPPDPTIDDTIPTQVGGTQANANNGTGGSGNLAFTGRTISGIAGLGGVLVVGGMMLWFAGQRRSRLATT